MKLGSIGGSSRSWRESVGRLLPWCGAAALLAGCLAAPATDRTAGGSRAGETATDSGAAAGDANESDADGSGRAGEVAGSPSDTALGDEAPSPGLGLADGGDNPSARPAEDAETPDGGASATAADTITAEAGPQGSGAGDHADGAAPLDAPVGDAGPGACSTLPELLGTTVRPWTGGCKACHDMTANPNLLKAPGPPWWHPTDDSLIVDYLLTHGLIDPVTPAESRFLLVPLAMEDGGLPHPGGDQVFAGTESYDAFLLFLEAAAPCVP